MNDIQNQLVASEPLAGKAKTSLILGVIGLVAWLLPIAGIPITITGLVKGIKAWNSSKHSFAVAGITLCIIGLVLSIINMSIGAYMGATGQNSLVNTLFQ